MKSNRIPKQAQEYKVLGREVSGGRSTSYIYRVQHNNYVYIALLIMASDGSKLHSAERQDRFPIMN
jgi:hypothetical protein